MCSENAERLHEISASTCVLACATLKPELELVMEKSGVMFPVYYIDSGKHVFPEKLRESIQEELDGIPKRFDTVLLLFGFCGNAMVGVRSGMRKLVLPKVADCIPIFLGSQDVRNGYGVRRYFFTRGYLEAESNVAIEYERMIVRYGEENARMISQEMLQHYENLSVIDTGAFETEEVVSALGTLSEVTSIPVDVLPGNLRIIEMLLNGDWSRDDFFIFESEAEITLDDSLSFQAISQVG